MKQRGYTLIELMTVFAMSVLVLFGIAIVYSSTLDYVKTTPERLDEYQAKVRVKTLLERYVTAAFLNNDDTDRLTYFLYNTESLQTSDQNTLVFTSLGKTVDGAFLRSEETDFETLNDQFGPQGGVAEVSLSLNPVGSEAQGDGLFIRIQNPADGDPTQGGTEQLLYPGVIDAQYEFWDGIEWTTTWDSITGQRRIPAAVRMRFTLDGDDRPVVFVFRLPGSDITVANPLTIGTDGQQP
ncbi:MAG: hypothetical protein R2688_10880 [Fimbriimonadaceae bacterium]|nr:hypothetical protein [Armatimonadota bacterium]